MKRLIVVLALGFLVLGSVRLAFAHGGGEIKIGKEPVGPYKMTVWLNPPTPQAGETMHITVGVLAEDDAPLLDAAVFMEMIDQANGEIVMSGPATTERSTNKLFYEIDFPAPKIGTYEISLQLTRGDVAGQVAFQTEVETANNTNWLVIGLVGVGLVLAAFLYFSSRNVDLQIPNSAT